MQDDYVKHRAGTSMTMFAERNCQFLLTMSPRSYLFSYLQRSIVLSGSKRSNTTQCQSESHISTFWGVLQEICQKYVSKINEKPSQFNKHRPFETRRSDSFRKFLVMVFTISITSPSVTLGSLGT